MAHLVRALVLALLLAPTARAELNYFNMHVGAVKNVSVGDVEKVAVGNEQVLGVSVLDTGELLLIPKAPGESDLFVWKPGQRMLTYRVNVLPGNIHRRLATVESVLSDFQDVGVRRVDGLIVVEGTVDPESMELFEQIVGGMQGVVSLVRPKPLAMRELIRIKAQVVEIDEQYRKEAGIRWDDSAEGPIISAVGSLATNDVFRVVPENGSVDWSGLADAMPVSDAGFHPFVGFSSALLSTIHLIEENGAARTLAEPVLTTRSGEAATFLSGGEIPYQAINIDGTVSVNFQTYGVQLEIEPIADDDGNILSNIVAEVSTVDFSVAVNGVPGLLSRRAQSTINAKSGETIVISGLLSTQDTSEVDKVPLLGDLPFLGRLFRSNSQIEQRKELVILVTPEIVSSEPELRPDLAENIAALRALKGGDSRIDAELME